MVQMLNKLSHGNQTVTCEKEKRERERVLYKGTNVHWNTKWNQLLCWLLQNWYKKFQLVTAHIS